VADRRPMTTSVEEADLPPFNQPVRRVLAVRRPRADPRARGSRGFDSPRLHSRFRALGGPAPWNLRLIFVGGIRKGCPYWTPAGVAARFEGDDNGGRGAP
jgi:hypothetical protein